MSARRSPTATTTIIIITVAVAAGWIGGTDPNASSPGTMNVSFIPAHPTDLTRRLPFPETKTTYVSGVHHTIITITTATTTTTTATTTTTRK